MTKLQQIYTAHFAAFTGGLHTALWHIMINKSASGAFYALHDGQLVLAQQTGGYVSALARFKDEIDRDTRKAILDDLNMRVFGLDHREAISLVGQSMAEKSPLEEIETIDLPQWSICYLINGDGSALTDDDIALADSWQASFGAPITIDVIDENADFEPFPEFGLACDCVKATIYRQH